MKFSITIKGSKEFKTSISVIQGIIDEATFNVNKEGMSFKGIDPSKVCYVSVNLPSEKFIKFNCDEETKFTIRTNEFSDVIKRAKNDEEITLEMDKNLLNIYLGGKKNFQIPLLAVESESPDPKFKLQTKISLKFAELDDYIKDIAVVADNFIVTSDGDKLKLSGKGDAGKVEIEVESAISQEEQGELRGEYMMEFLQSAIKNLKGGFEEVILEHGHDMPLKLSFNNPDVGTLIYVQAPKVI